MRGNPIMVYFVFPIYNEENNIRKIIPEVRSLMKGKPYRIIAVNDGSSDGSQKVLDEFMGDDIIIDGSEINMNIGAVFSLAVDRVLRESASHDDIMVIMESDQTSKVNLAESLIGEIENNGFDITIASRYQKGGCYRNFPLSRLMFSRGVNYFLRKIFPIHRGVKDYTIFLRAYRVGIFSQLIELFGQSGTIQSQGFIANSELLIKAALLTGRIKEVPFVYDYGKKIGKSKMNVIRTINEYFVFAFYMKNLISKMNKMKIARGANYHYV